MNWNPALTEADHEAPERFWNDLDLDDIAKSFIGSLAAGLVLLVSSGHACGGVMPARGCSAAVEVSGSFSSVSTRTARHPRASCRQDRRECAQQHGDRLPARCRHRRATARSTPAAAAPAPSRRAGSRRSPPVSDLDVPQHRPHPHAHGDSSLRLVPNGGRKRGQRPSPHRSTSAAAGSAHPLPARARAPRCGCPAGGRPRSAVAPGGALRHRPTDHEESLRAVPLEPAPPANVVSPFSRHQ
jgi:hypothetical protein